MTTGRLLVAAFAACLLLLGAPADALSQNAAAPAAPTAPAAAPRPAAPAAAAAPKAPQVNAAALVGKDLKGTACRWEQRVDLPVERNLPVPVNIFCGKAKHPAGFVTATTTPLGLPADVAQRRKLIEAAAQDTAAGREYASRITCSAGQWATTPGGIDIMLQPCALNDSEWPQVVVLAVMGPMLLRAEGLPSTLPAFETAMTRMSGADVNQTAAKFGDAAAARSLLVKAGGQRWLTSSAEDLDDYRDLTETARVEASRKNFGAAEEHYRRALVILTNTFGDQSLGVGLLTMELALQVSNQERFDEAGALFRRADPIIQSKGTAADRARLLLYLGFDAANRGRFDEALEFVDNAAATWRGMIAQGGLDTDQLNTDQAQAMERGELAFALDLEAEMALRTGNLSAADASASEGEEIIAEVPGLPPWWRADILTTIGEIRAEQGRLDDADQNFRAALILDERLFGDTAPTATTYLTFGRVFTEQKLYAQAVRAFRLALAILRKDEVARGEVVVDQMTPFIVAANEFAQRDPSQRAALDGEIFEATQMIGKSLVDDTVNRVAARLAAAAPALAGVVDELERTRRERDSARISLAQEVSLPDDQRGSEREASLMAQINAATAKADALQKRIEAEFPNYASFAHPGPVTLAEAQKQLRGDEALVLIEAGRERSFVVLVRKDRLIARPIGLDAGAIANDVTALRKAFVVRERAIEAFDVGLSYRLYRGLFGPVESGLDGINHLVVVPTGALASLPMALLVTQAPAAGAAQDYADASWLIRRTAIAEEPSARAFVSQREQGASAQAPRPLLAVANPDFVGTPNAGANAPSGLDKLDNACRSEGPVPPELLRALPPLPDTADEVRKVGAILHADSGSLLMGADATEPRFRAMPLDQYRVLYFATHGLLPTAMRCQSEPALVLSPPRVPAKSKDADGVLDASEVAEFHLNADLVVLSACNTATGGGQFGGESLSGLAGAFFHAGARSVLASHWEVPSAQTVQLMTGLFQRLGPNLTGGIATALRESQLALIAQPQTAHPFFWAAFTLIGDGGAAASGGSSELVPVRPAAETAAGDRAESTAERQP